MKRIAFITHFALIITSTSFAAPQSKDVNIVNAPDVNVINTPTVNAQQSSNWSVEVKGTPGVIVDNSELNPVPVKTLNHLLCERKIFRFRVKTQKRLYVHT